MPEIIWKEPPPPKPRGPGSVDWNEVTRPFVENPGQWGIARHYKSKTGANDPAKKIREGKLPLVIGKWDAVSRPGENGNPEGPGSDLYVVYLGENGEYEESARPGWAK